MRATFPVAAVMGVVHGMVFVALGDHLTERSEEDAYHQMLNALDFGCLYHWNNDLTVISDDSALTEHMYPFTPVELREGVGSQQEHRREGRHDSRPDQPFAASGQSRPSAGDGQPRGRNDDQPDGE